MLHDYVSRASLYQPAITILSHEPLHTLHLCTACTYLVIATHYIFSLGQVTEVLTQQASNLGTTSFSFPLLRSNDPKPKMPSLGKAVKSLKKGLPSSSSNFESTWSRLSRCCCEGFIYATQHFQVYWSNLYFTPGHPYPSHSLQVLSKGICNLAHCTTFAICTTEVRVMVAYTIFKLLFIAPGYQIYINYLMNVNG